MKMEENLYSSASNLLCSETTSSFYDDGLDFDELEVSPACDNHLKNQVFNQQDPFFINNGSTSVMGWSGFAIQSDDRIKEMVEKEVEHLPEDDYLKRLRSGDLNLSVRGEALDWILKASAYYRFGPLSLCLSINYLDRFLSVYDLPRGQTWTVQLLAVACISIAAKMEETEMPMPVDLQSIDGGWWGELDAGIDFLEFRPSEITAAVAISVSGDMQTVAIDKAISSFTFVEKDRILKCVELMKNLSFINGSAPVPTPQHTSTSSTVPQSPIGVLDAAACLSYKSDEITVGTYANSSHSSPDMKRRKHDNNDNNRKASQSQQDFKP